MTEQDGVDARREAFGHRQNDEEVGLEIERQRGSNVLDEADVEQLADARLFGFSVARQQACPTAEDAQCVNEEALSRGYRQPPRRVEHATSPASSHDPRLLRPTTFAKLPQQAIPAMQHNHRERRMSAKLANGNNGEWTYSGQVSEEGSEETEGKDVTEGAEAMGTDGELAGEELADLVVAASVATAPMTVASR